MLQGYAFVPEGDEEALKEAVYSRGPLAVSLDAGHPSFRFYSHGKRHSINDKRDVSGSGTAETRHCMSDAIQNCPWYLQHWFSVLR